MKTKSSLYFRMTLPILFLLSCTNHQTTEPAPSAEILQTTILGDLLNKFIDDNFSMQNVASLARTAYGVDFDREYQKIFPRLITDRPLQIEARGLDLAMKDIAMILQTNGITAGTPVYQYLEDIINLFEDEQSETYMMEGFSRLQAEVQLDQVISDSDRKRLVGTFILLKNNYSGIVKIVTMNLRQISNERSQGLFGRVWRVVRSIIVTSSIGALIGFETGGPVGAAIGAAVTTTAAVSDAQFNHYCHFALQCDGGWRQDCVTGECMPYIQ